VFWFRLKSLHVNEGPCGKSCCLNLRMRQESPMAKAKVQMSTEFTEIKTTVSELARKVNAIQKELKE